MTLGKILKKYRFDTEISAKELADRSGVSPAYISILEKGKNPNGSKPNPSKETYTSLANAMGMSYDELIAMLEEEDNPKEYENRYAIPSNKYGLLEMCLNKIGWTLESTKNGDEYDFTLNNGTFAFGVTVNEVDMLAEGLYAFMSMAVEALMKESYERMVENMHKKPIANEEKPIREAPYTKEDVERILGNFKKS